jgi:starch-binding outer membrane protein SusE/F
MKKYLVKCFAIIVSILIFISCKKEEEAIPVYGFTATPTASTNTVILNNGNDAQSVITISWTKPNYTTSGAIKYTLQFDSPADTSGSTAWANAISIDAGVDVLSKSILGKDLNKIAADLGLYAKEENNLVVRVQSYLGNANISKTIILKVTPYRIPKNYPAIYVAGDFQGWKIVSPKNDGIYEGYIYIPAGGTNEFKLYAQPDWAPTSYGDDGKGNVIVANYAGANFKAPSDGYYLLSVNLNTKKTLLMKTSWGVIGSASPGGWDNDTPMSYDPKTQLWTVSTKMIKEGSFKMRANKEWKLDFGINSSGKLSYANHPWYTYIEQPQLTVPQDGNYTITLDLQDPEFYSYKIKKN